MHDVAGVILAGGRASRMGGGDKSLLPLGGRRIIDHVLMRLSPQVTRVAINANGPSHRWSEFGVPCLPDPIDGQPGPLAGLLAGLDWAAEQGFGRVISVAADTPFFPLDLVQRLSENAPLDGVVLAASRNEEGEVVLQPTFGLWPVSLRQDLRHSLMGGERKLRAWAGRHGARPKIIEGGEDVFFNINTPDDLRRAEVLSARISSA